MCYTSSMNFIKSSIAVAVGASLILGISACSSSVLSTADKDYLSVIQNTAPELSGSDTDKILAGKKFCSLIISSGSMDSAFTQFGNVIFKNATDEAQAKRTLLGITSGAVLSYCPQHFEDFKAYLDK